MKLNKCTKDQVFSCKLVDMLISSLDIGNFEDDCFVENPSTAKEVYNYLSWFYGQVSGGGVTQFYEVMLPAKFTYAALFECVRYIGLGQIYYDLVKVHDTFPIRLREIPHDTGVPVQRSDWALGITPGSEETKRLLDKLDSSAVCILPWLTYQMTLLALSDVDAFPKLKRSWETARKSL